MPTYFISLGGVVHKVESNFIIPRFMDFPYRIFIHPEHTSDVNIYLIKTDKHKQKILDNIPGRIQEFLQLPIINLLGIDNSIYNVFRKDSSHLFFRDPNSKELIVVIQNSVGGYESKYIFFQNLKHILTTFLCYYDAFPIHCLGIVRNNQSLLFLAPDGGGKSTLMGLADNSGILNDDIVIIRKIDKNILAYPTPFGTKTTVELPSPIKGIFYLEKSTEFQILPVTKGEMIQCVYDGLHGLTDNLRPHERKRIFSLVSEMCSKVPCYRLRFPKNYVDWNLVDMAVSL